MHTERWATHCALRAAMVLGLCTVAYTDDDTPKITHTGTVAPDTIGITIRARRTEHAKQVPYAPQPGDEVDEKHKRHRWLKRDGRPIGALVGPDRKRLYPVDKLIGSPLDTAWADRPGSYTVTSPDDPAFAQGLEPTAVHRKSKPTDMAQLGPWYFGWPMVHVVYLRLPKPLTVSKRYRVEFADGRFPAQDLVHDPTTARSEAVHVSHLGFRPDDPAKVAFLSCWLGNGGRLSYGDGAPFRVVDAKTGETAFEGTAVLSKAADDKTEDPYKRNYNGTDVYLMDFSALTKPGSYRVVVDGIGCSYPFSIGDDSWERAFVVSARGLYHQRNGIAIGPPHSTFRRPRAFHPDDGVKIYASTTPLMDSGNGINARGTDKDNFGNLVKGKTDEIVPNAWGGYFDAGDWDRRIQHLIATRLLLELMEMFPDYFASIDLNIPESGNDLPDAIDEALWGLDVYRRMQTPDGGIRGGIESAEHPRHGEASWQESLAIMAYAPGTWSSYIYAGDAARAAYALRTRKPNLSRAYAESATRAMRWAEKQYANHDYKKLPHAVPDARNRAAAELFRLTGEKEWHDLFRQTTAFVDPARDLYKWKSHNQRDAAFVYLRTDGADERIKANARKALLREAEECLTQGERTGFKWTKSNPWAPVGYGMMTTPQAATLIRAHYLTGDARYLRAAVLACQYGAGANPDNLCFTTGLGHASPQHPLVIDQRVTGQAPPPGITVFGPFDMKRNAGDWYLKLLKQVTCPPPSSWPTAESYFDVFLFPPVTEFTIQTNIGPNAYVWGYLAARQ